jgi:[acyl-carrier-protein] S-malonyltransferase
MAKAALLFPGQGAQFVGMGRDFCEASPAARETFEQANAALGFRLSDICFNGDAERLNDTSICQPAILVMSIAVLRAVREKMGDGALLWEAAAGLSLGEYTALVAAGALDFVDAVRLVHKRGSFMQAAAVERPGSMASVIGLSDDVVEAVCAQARAKGVVVAANLNCPGQVVISGEKAAVEAACALAQEKGARMAVPLKVSGAFHSPLMQPAQVKLAAELDATKFATAKIPVVSNVSGEYMREPDDVRSALKRQVTSAVLWHHSIQRLIADGFDAFYEVGPGKVLTGLMKRIDKTKRAVNINTTQYEL